MTLHDATLPGTQTLPFRRGAGPVPCTELEPLQGQAFVLPAGDAFVTESGTDAHVYLDGARRAWREIPDHMDFLAEDSPIRMLKWLEYELYADRWRSHWADAARILDVGAGVGRFALPFLEEGRAVEAVDADLLSLRTLVSRAAGGPGQLDVHWTAAWALPEIEPVDLAIACEVLCYVPEVDRAMKALVDRLRPGGTLLLSVEAKWGWACAADAPDGGLESALMGPDVLTVGRDTWVRTYDQDDVVALLSRHGLETVEVMPTHYVLDGPLEQVGEVAMGLDRLLDVERRCRAHPVWAPLNRIWTAVAKKA
ncbi:MAG: class I SAM-dependent methyltransferase [Myxococcota bacterium]